MIKHSSASMIKFEDIKMHPDLHNRPVQQVDELIRSIRLIGLRHPLVVWQVRASKKAKSEYYLLGGFRRHAAINAIRGEDPSQFEMVPVLKWEGTLEDAQFEMDCDNLNRKDPSSAETAAELARLKSLGHSQVKIAKRLGMSEAWVSRMLKFHKHADKKVKEAVNAGEIPMDAAQDIATDPDNRKKARDPKEQKKLLEEAKKASKSKKSAKKKVAKKDKKAGKAKSASVRPSKADIQEALKRVPEGDLDEVTTAAATGFEFALRYAAGEIDLETALEGAGINVNAGSPSPTDQDDSNVEPPEMDDLVPDLDEPSENGAPREGENEDGDEESIPF